METGKNLTYKVMDGVVGRKAWKPMFKQFWTPDYPAPIWDIEEWKAIFLAEKDITEYKAAIKCAGNWETWCLIKRDWPSFVDLVEKWKIELEQKLRSDALNRLIELMDTGNDTIKASCAKFIAQSQWSKSEVGRPSRTEQKKAAQELARAAATTVEEEQRIQQFILTSNDTLQ